VYKPGSDRDQLVITLLADRFGNKVEQEDFSSDMPVINVQNPVIHEVLLFLRDHAELQYNFLTTLCGMHYPESSQLGVVYHLHSFANNHRIRIKTRVNQDQPVLPTLTDIWPSANWMERETYDFFGITFDGHPNLKRILNVDEMTDFPLRKDFPLEDQTRDDKDDSMFGR
jgi:NADH-quinone oxidoreductase subunit C